MSWPMSTESQLQVGQLARHGDGSSPLV
uniref:Uncharacterized protein n=1 Tax=Anguilla anguilla TaxID=7936 RepID=A0A0E9TBW0_ANGAN